MEIIIIAVLLGLIPGAIAYSKGRSFVKWWLLGALLWIVVFPITLFMAKDQAALDARQIKNGAAKKCPQCAELIRPDAAVCKFCGSHQ